MRTTRRVRSILAVATMAAVLLATGAPALSAIKIGTDNAETLIGTNGNDQLTGKGGAELLRGLAGNDVYYFKDGWGSDTLEENASYKVGGKKVPGGSDTLSFRGVTGGPVDVRLIHQWGPTYNRAYGPGGEIVNLDTSIVENAVGTSSSSGDIIRGGGEKNTLQPGGGVNDDLRDYGGWNDGAGGSLELPASNDTFKGLTQNTGTVLIRDWGGTADVVDLRPFGAGDVYMNAMDVDGNGTNESLQIVTGGSSQIMVWGHFGEIGSDTSLNGQHGRIERLVFADGTFSGAGDVGGASLSGKKLTAKQQKLAKVAPALADEARRLLADAPSPGE